MPTSSQAPLAALSRLSEAPRTAVWVAVNRATRACLPATLLQGEWEESVAFFRGRCAYCQQGPAESLDHYYPLALCGGSTKDNCVPACLLCQQKKGALPPDQVVAIPRQDMQRVAQYLRQFAVSDSWLPLKSIKQRAQTVQELLAHLLQDHLDPSLVLHVTGVIHLLLQLEIEISHFNALSGETQHEQRTPFLNEPTVLLLTAYLDASSGQMNEWINLSPIGNCLKRLDPSFAPCHYGTKNLLELVQRYTPFFEIHMISQTSVEIRPRDRVEALLLHAHLDAVRIYGSPWVLLAQVGTQLRKISPTFSPQQHGARQLSLLIGYFPQLFELRSNAITGHIEVRLRATSEFSSAEKSE